MLKMKLFIKSLLSNTDDVSHKRIISILSFIVLIAMVIIYAAGKQVNDTLIYVFASLCGGQSILSVIEKFKK